MFANYENVHVQYIKALYFTNIHICLCIRQIYQASSKNIMDELGVVSQVEWKLLVVHQLKGHKGDYSRGG